MIDGPFCYIRKEGSDVNESELLEILKLKIVAVVGCSPQEERPSHYVAAYLQQAGYRIIPVNPGCDKILGEKCYPNLLEIPEKVELVNIFRRSEHVFPIVQDAVRIGAKAVWMQDGVEHPLSAETALKAGLKVVMNDCIMRVHQRYNGPFGRAVTTC